MKVSTLKRNPGNMPQTFINVGVSGIMDLCERLIFANNADVNFTVQEDVQPERLRTVPVVVLVSHREQMRRSNDNQTQDSALRRGTRGSSRASLRLCGQIVGSRVLINGERIARPGGEGYQRQTNSPANPLSIENGGGKCLPVIIGRAKNANNAAADCTQTISSLLRITQNYGLWLPTVGRFVNPVTTKPTLTGARR